MFWLVEGETCDSLSSTDHTNDTWPSPYNTSISGHMRPSTTTTIYCRNSLTSQQSLSQPEDYRISGKLQEHVYCSRIHDIAQLKLRFIEESKHFNKIITRSLIKQSGSVIHAFKLAQSILRPFRTQTLNVFDFWAMHNNSLSVTDVTLPIVDTSCYQAETATTFADVNRFYRNLVIRLQLDVALLVQNFTKIRHCLPELWKRIQADTVQILTASTENC